MLSYLAEPIFTNLYVREHPEIIHDQSHKNYEVFVTFQKSYISIFQQFFWPGFIFRFIVFRQVLYS
ncbi:TPA: hypothetical protein DEG21_02505 [Patescibacteria group bacterium]|nr:hypothetical protein [Candidatus Gracilibacteria bacterium]